MTVEEVIDVSDIEMLYVQFAANQMGAIIAPARAARCTGAEKYHAAMVLGGSYGRSPWLSHAACMVATLGSSLSERPAQYRVPIRRRAASRSSLMGMSTANRLLPSHVRKTGLLKFSAVKMACTKTLLADLSDFRNDDGSALALDNIEGLTLGPVVGGKQTLILVSDNNFGAAQFTQFIALEVTPVPEPATWALWLGGLVGLQALRRCR